LLKKIQPLLRLMNEIVKTTTANRLRKWRLTGASAKARPIPAQKTSQTGCHECRRHRLAANAEQVQALDEASNKL